MNHPPILVIGSTGKTGRRIVQRLSENGHTVRNGSRQSEPPFDWEKPSTWPEALRGVEAAYISFYPDLAVPGAPAAIEEFTSCAIKAGVKHLVLSHVMPSIVEEQIPQFTDGLDAIFTGKISVGHDLARYGIE